MMVAVAVLGEEDVSPIMTCTCAGLVHGVSDVEDTLSMPLVKASATFKLLAMELHVSYIL